MNLTAIRERIAVQAVSWAPKGLVSAAVGWGARRALPRPLRAPAYKTFSRIVGARVDEAEMPLSEYASLSEFFARRLCPGVRHVTGEQGGLTSPCDGRVAALGQVEHDRMVQAKGKDYTLSELLADPERAGELAGGVYMTIYLSPKDYHRVHAPLDGELVGYDYIPGSYFPVNPLFSRSVEQLMARNERVAFHFDTFVGPMSLVMVAALGVSNIEVAHADTETRYLRGERKQRTVRFDQPIHISRGDEIGTFHLGSTTILVFQEHAVDLSLVEVGDVLRFGQVVGRIQTPDSAHVGQSSKPA